MKTDRYVSILSGEAVTGGGGSLLKTVAWLSRAVHGGAFGHLMQKHPYPAGLREGQPLGSVIHSAEEIGLDTKFDM